jgi:hypothetical protein
MKVEVAEERREMPKESVYICSVVTDHGEGPHEFRVQSAAVSGVEPHEAVRREHP